MKTIVQKFFSDYTDDQKAEAKAFFNRHFEKFVPHDEWYECTIGDIVCALECIGFSDVKVYFSGFCSQGDGAQFVGNYRYKKGGLAKVKKDYPQWTDLHDLAQALQTAEAKHFYNIRARIRSSGHYSHEYCTAFDFEDIRHNHGWVSEHFEESDFIDPMRSFMRAIYRMLEQEYDYLSSFETVWQDRECWDHVIVSAEEIVQ